MTLRSSVFLICRLQDPALTKCRRDDAGFIGGSGPMPLRGGGRRRTGGVDDSSGLTGFGRNGR